MSDSICEVKSPKQHGESVLRRRFGWGPAQNFGAVMQRVRSGEGGVRVNGAVVADPGVR